jgi:hypothetical protein
MAEIDWESGKLTEPDAEPDWDSGVISEPKPKNIGTLGDLGTDIKRGVLGLPGVATGLLDIPVAAVTGDRMVSKGWEAIGGVTGFQPGKWAEEARQEYSPQRVQAEEEINQAWEDGTAGEIAGAYLTNPALVAGKVAEAVPSMLVGGVVGRAALGAARGIGALATPTTAAQAARQAAIGAGIGEGAVTAGSTMQQIDESADPRLAALAATGAGVVGGALGGAGTRIAQRAGLVDVEGALAGGVQRLADAPAGVGRRVAGGALTEGAEEALQSSQEQAWQNFAEDKPLAEGMARAAVEGAIAGGALGAGFNVMPGSAAQEEDQQPDLIQPTPTPENPAPAPVVRPDPAAGPLSAAAAKLPSAAPARAIPAPDAATLARLQGRPQPEQPQYGPEETRIREAIADTDRRARLGGMTPLLAAEQQRLYGELMALRFPQQPQKQDFPRLEDTRSDFYASEDGMTTTERGPWVRPERKRVRPEDRLQGIDQVPRQPLEGELLTTEYPVARQNQAGRIGYDGPLEGEVMGGEVQPSGPRKGIEGRVFEGEFSPAEQRAIGTEFKKREAADSALKRLPAPERFTVEQRGNTFRLLPAPQVETASPVVEQAAPTVEQPAKYAAPKPKGQRKTIDRERDSVVQAAIRLGGITKQWKQDTTGDTVGNKNIPGVGALWSDKTGTSIDDMASMLDAEGYVPPEEMSKDGGVSWLQAAIRDELGGRPHYAPGSQRQAAILEQEQLDRYADEVAASLDRVEAEYARIEELYGPDAAADARDFDQRLMELDAQLDQDIADAEDTFVDGEPAAGPAPSDDQLRAQDAGAGEAQAAEAEPFALDQQTEAGLTERQRQQEAAQKAAERADREASPCCIVGCNRP